MNRIVNFNFIGHYNKAEFGIRDYDKNSKEDKKVIRGYDKKYLTKVGDKKLNLPHIGLMAGLGAGVGYGSGQLTNMYKQKNAGLQMSGKGAKAKIIGAGIGAGLSGGLSYYLQTRKTRKDKGLKRK